MAPKKIRALQKSDRHPACAIPGSMAGTPLGDFWAANPVAHALHQEHLHSIHQKLNVFLEGLKPLLNSVINKAESLRQLGNVMAEFARTLPGQKFTRDFYEQLKGEFVDAHGQPVSFEVLEWSIKVAREHVSPITGFNDAVKVRQILLLATGEETFRLEAATVDRGSVVTPPDPLRQLRSLLDVATWRDRWQKVQSSEHYWKEGRLVPEQRELLAQEFKPVFELLDQIREELGQ